MLSVYKKKHFKFSNIDRKSVKDRKGYTRSILKKKERKEGIVLSMLDKIDS
jgi:hypothetical protein